MERYKNKFIILSNSDGARNFKLSYTDIDKYSKENWKDLIPYNDDVYIFGFSCLKDYIVVLFKENGNNMIKLLDFDGENVKSTYLQIIQILKTIHFQIWTFMIQTKYYLVMNQ